MSSAKKARGRQLLEQRLLSYRRNPAFIDAAPDGVSAVQRVEGHLRQLDELAIATNVDLPDPNPRDPSSTSG
jgi:hypothetical protein